MQGLISSRMQQAAQPPMAEGQSPAPEQPPAQPQEQSGQGKYKSGVDKAVPPEHQEDFERVVLAGMQLMYSEEMKDEIDALLQDERPIEQRLAEGITGLMALLDQQAKPAIPLPVIIPAAVELLYEIATFLAQVRAIPALAPEQMQEAVQLTVGMIAKRYGMPDEQIVQMLTGQAGQGAPEAGAAVPPQPMGA